LFSIIEQAIQDLKNMGKELHPDDQTRILQKVDNMKQVEKELIKIGMYLEEYRQLMDTFKDYKSELLTYDQIRQFVEKRESLLTRQTDEESNLLEILGSLQKLCLGKSDDFVESGYKKIDV